MTRQLSAVNFRIVFVRAGGVTLCAQRLLPNVNYMDQLSQITKTVTHLYSGNSCGWLLIFLLPFCLASIWLINFKYLFKAKIILNFPGPCYVPIELSYIFCIGFASWLLNGICFYESCRIGVYWQDRQTDLLSMWPFILNQIEQQQEYLWL